MLVLNSTVVDFRRVILVARGACPTPRVCGSSGEPQVRSDSDLGSGRVGFAVVAGPVPWLLRQYQGLCPTKLGTYRAMIVPGQP